jgi:hypothetical protein
MARPIIKSEKLFVFCALGVAGLLVIKAVAALLSFLFWPLVVGGIALCADYHLTQKRERERVTRKDEMESHGTTLHPLPAINRKRIRNRKRRARKQKQVNAVA